VLSFQPDGENVRQEEVQVTAEGVVADEHVVEGDPGEGSQLETTALEERLAGDDDDVLPRLTGRNRLLARRRCRGGLLWDSGGVAGGRRGRVGRCSGRLGLSLRRCPIPHGYECRYEAERKSCHAVPCLGPCLHLLLPIPRFPSIFNCLGYGGKG